MIALDFVLQIKFDRDFIFKMMPKKKSASQGNLFLYFCIFFFLCHPGYLSNCVRFVSILSLYLSCCISVWHSLSQLRTPSQTLFLSLLPHTYTYTYTLSFFLSRTPSVCVTCPPVYLEACAGESHVPLPRTLSLSVFIFFPWFWSHAIENMCAQVATPLAISAPNTLPAAPTKKKRKKKRNGAQSAR